MKFIATLGFSFPGFVALAQTELPDTTYMLDELVIPANKIPEMRSKIGQQVHVISALGEPFGLRHFYVQRSSDNTSDRRNQIEQVDVWALAADFQKSINLHDIRLMKLIKKIHTPAKTLD